MCLFKKVLKSLSKKSIKGKNGIFAFVFFALIVLCPANLRAQDLSITLQDAIQKAKSQNASLKAKALELEYARKVDASSWNNFLPNISASGSLSQSHTIYNAQGASTGASGAQNNPWSWSGSAGVSLNINASIPLKIKQNTLNYHSAKTAYDKLESDIIQQVTNAFFALITSAKNINLLQQNYTRTKEQLSQVKKNYALGLASELEVLKAEYALSEQEPSIAQAKSTYKSDKEAFLTLIGLDTSTNFTIVNTMTVQKINLPSAETLAERYLEKRFDIIQAHEAVAKAELNKTLTQTNAYSPSLGISESVRVGGNIPTNGQSATKPNVNGSFSLSLSIPVTAFIPNSQTNLSIQSAKNAVTSAELSLESTRASAKQDIAKKASAVTNQYDTLLLNKSNAAIAKKAYNLSLDAYKNGLSSQSELNTQRQDYVKAEQTVLQGEVNYFTSLYALANALNISVEELLNEYGEE